MAKSGRPLMPRACLKNHSCNLHIPIYGIFFQRFVVKMWSNQENRVRKRMLRHAQRGNKFPRCRAVALYISMKETSFSSKLEGGFSL